MGAKRTMENCHSLCLSPSVWRQREDKVDRAPILLPHPSHWIWIEGWSDAQMQRTEIAWGQKWDVVRALPRCCSEPGDSGGWGGHFGRHFHLSSCMIFCPGCRACGGTEGVAEQAWPGHGCELQLAAPWTLWAKEERKEPVCPASAACHQRSGHLLGTHPRWQPSAP